jgi:hypothetical protein
MPKLSDFLSVAKIALPLDAFIPRVIAAVEIAIEEGEAAGMKEVTKA